MQFGYKKNRPVLLLAPDAIITINQDISLPVCGDCGAKSNIVDLVTRINVNLSLDSTPGTASFDLAVPKHSSSQVYNQGKLNIPLMSEIQIFFKGRFLDSNNQPQYYQSFWGLVTNLEYGYSDGFYTIHVSCEDMLKWWDISKVISQDSALNAYNVKNPFRALSSVYSNLTAPEVIYALSLAMFSDQALVTTPNTGSPSDLTNIIQSQGATYTNILEYWRKRFSTLSDPKYLSLTGLTLSSARVQAIKAAITSGASPASGTFTYKTPSFAPLETKQNGFFQAPDEALPLYQELSGSQDPLVLGVKSALSIANEASERINYEFFMDTGGVITFKAPYYNMNTKNLDAYLIKDLDLISYQITHNLDNIYTRIDIEGSWYHDNSLVSRPSVFYIDPVKSRDYGVKEVKRSYNYIRDTNQLFTLAIAELNRLNSKEFTGNIEIAGRPEIKLGYPVFLECENLYGYVRSINHSFDFGQSFTTSLGIDTIRRESKNDSFIKISPDSTALEQLKKGLQSSLQKSASLSTLFKNWAGNKNFPTGYGDFIKKATASQLLAFQGFVKQQKPNQQPNADASNSLDRLANLTFNQTNFATESAKGIPTPLPPNAAYLRVSDGAYDIISGFPYGYGSDPFKLALPSPVVFKEANAQGTAVSAQTQSAPCTCKEAK